MTKTEAIAWVADNCNEDDLDPEVRDDHDRRTFDRNDLDKAELLAAYIALYESHPGLRDTTGNLYVLVLIHPDCQFGKYGRCNGAGQEGYGPCSARHECDGNTFDGEMIDHACPRCKQYTPESLTGAGRLCPDCLKARNQQ